MTLQVRYAVRSHTGLLRTSNEDSAYAGPRLLAVADGMGGHAAGEVASAVAIAALASLDADVPGHDLLSALRERAGHANAELRAMTERDPSLAGMGTTLVALLFDRGRLGLLHVGDSRCYLLRDEVLSQITHDHTLVQALVDEGRITEEAAHTHPQRSVITNVLDGRDGDVQPDLSVREARAGDRYLLCSDGLTGPVSSSETLREALLLPDRQEACDRLVQLALRGGGPDNVTVVVADVVDDGEPDLLPVVAGAAAEQPQDAPDGLVSGAAARAQVAEGRDTPAPRRYQVMVRPRRRARTTIAAAVVVLVLLAIGLVTRGYVRSQYYVGLDGAQVVVYRGVQGSVAGVDLAQVQERTTLTTARLPELERQRLEDGIVAHDARDAREIVQRLIATACATAVPTPHTGPSGLPGFGPSPGITPGPTQAPAPALTPAPTASPCP
jgi:protein phosphatase